MSAPRKLLDDLAKLATAAAGIAQGAGKEVELLARQRLERFLDRMDLVTREEFQVVKEMAREARLENERLAARIAELEARAGAPKAAAKTRATRRRRSPKS